MKAGSYLLSFKRLNKNNGNGVPSAGGSQGEITRNIDNCSNPSSLRWRFKNLSQGEVTRDIDNCSKPLSLKWRFKNLSSGLRWKKKTLYKLRHWFVDSFLFKIVSVFEAIALVSTLAFFFFCCGCHI